MPFPSRRKTPKLPFWAFFLCGVLMTSITFSQVPRIDGFAPAKPKAGETITLYGENFDNAIVQASCPIGNAYVSAHMITFQLLNACPGIMHVEIKTLSGQARMSIPIDTTAPAEPVNVTGLTPVSGGPGTVITISGSGLNNVKGIYILNPINFKQIYLDSFTIVSPTQIRATIGNQPTWGTLGIDLKTGGGIAFGHTFSYPQAPPYITGISPYRNITRGTTVTILGANLGTTRSVKFGTDTAASFTVVNAATVQAVVGSLKNFDGTVNITTDYGTYSRDGLIALPSFPSVSTFSPNHGKRGDTITIRGQNLDYIGRVYFGGTPALAFRAVNDSTIKAIVNNGSTGPITLHSTSGVLTTDSIFTFGATVRPDITSFSPNYGYEGDSIVLKGTAFTGATSVTVGGVAGRYLYVYNDSTAGFELGKGASGSIVLTTPKGADTIASFNYLSSGNPVINQFSPATAKTGDTIYIYGSRLIGSYFISFGGVQGKIIYDQSSDTLVKAIVDWGSSGNIELKARFGTVEKSGFIHAGPAPLIYGFMPKSGARGDIITINGRNLANCTQVRFNDWNASSFIIIADTVIKAVIGDGNSVNGELISVTTPAGTASASGFIYINRGEFHISEFKAVLLNNNVIVSWQTSLEKYTAHFAITGVLGSDTIIRNTLPAAGFSDSTIQYRKAYPAAAAGRYVFTLRAYDQMGNNTNIAIDTLVIHPETFPDIGSYPNPANDHTTIQHPASPGATIMLFNMNGTLVQSNSVKTGDIQTTIYFNSLPKGMYKVVWTNGSTSRSATILVR